MNNLIIDIFRGIFRRLSLLRGSPADAQEAHNVDVRGNILQPLRGALRRVPTVPSGSGTGEIATQNHLWLDNAGSLNIRPAFVGSTLNTSACSVSIDGVTLFSDRNGIFYTRNAPFTRNTPTSPIDTIRSFTYPRSYRPLGAPTDGLDTPLTVTPAANYNPQDVAATFVFTQAIISSINPSLGGMDMSLDGETYITVIPSGTDTSVDIDDLKDILEGKSGITVERIPETGGSNFAELVVSTVATGDDAQLHFRIKEGTTPDTDATFIPATGHTASGDDNIDPARIIIPEEALLSIREGSIIELSMENRNANSLEIVSYEFVADDPYVQYIGGVDVSPTRQLAYIFAAILTAIDIQSANVDSSLFDIPTNRFYVFGSSFVYEGQSFASLVLAVKIFNPTTNLKHTVTDYTANIGEKFVRRPDPSTGTFRMPSAYKVRYYTTLADDDRALSPGGSPYAHYSNKYSPDGIFGNDAYGSSTTGYFANTTEKLILGEAYSYESTAVSGPSPARLMLGHFSGGSAVAGNVYSNNTPDWATFYVGSSLNANDLFAYIRSGTNLGVSSQRDTPIGEEDIHTVPWGTIVPAGVSVITHGTLNPAYELVTTDVWPRASLEIGVGDYPDKDVFAPLQATGTAGVPGTLEDRTYAWSWVVKDGDWEQESRLSVPSTLVTMFPRQNAVLTDFARRQLSGRGYNDTFHRIYRAVGNAWLLVGQIPAVEGSPVITYTDTKHISELGEAARSLDWHAPPTDITDLIALPNGVTVAASKQTVHLSEPYRPHAWPHTIILDDTIKALGVMDTTLVAFTEREPVLIIGTHPSTMTAVKTDIPYVPVTKYCVSSIQGAIYYVSATGLIRMTSQGSANMTTELFTASQWLDIARRVRHGHFYDNQYIAFYDPDSIIDDEYGFIFDMLTGSFVTHGVKSRGAVADHTGQYSPDGVASSLVMLGDDRFVADWGRGDPLTVKWVSRVFQPALLGLRGFRCVKVEAADYTDAGDLRCVVRAGDDPDPSTMKDLYNVRVTSPWSTYIKSGSRLRYWQIEVTSKTDVYSVGLSERKIAIREDVSLITSQITNVNTNNT